MPSSNQSGVLDDADLHALVDGHVRDDSRKAILRVLATSPGERARVDAWQRQNELLRSTFVGVEHESLPAMLDLSAKARLQCIPANDAPLVAPAPNLGTKSARRIHIAAVAATIAVITIGLGGSWLLFDSSRSDTIATSAAVLVKQPVENGMSRLPTARIPDLTEQGFRFVRADTKANSSTIRFSYANGVDDVVVSVSNGPSASVRRVSAPTWTDEGFSWQSRNADFLLTGTIAPEKLRELALALQKEEQR